MSKSVNENSIGDLKIMHVIGSTLFYSFEYRNKLLDDVKLDDKLTARVQISQMNYALDNLPIQL